MNIGILFMLGVSSLSVLGIVMAGWASNSHYPLIGALRSSAQMGTTDHHIYVSIYLLRIASNRRSLSIRMIRSV